MKILSFADAASIHTQKWALSFAERGHDIHIVSFNPAKLDCAQVYVVNTGTVLSEGGNWHYLFGLPTARHYVSKVEPDLICCHYLTSYGLMGALLKSSLPLVTWLHGTDILVTPDRSVVYRLMARYALSRADLIIMAAAHMQPRVQDLLRGKKRRMMVVPVGVNLSMFNQTKLSARQAFTCISNRHLVKNSNVDLLLNAIAHVQQEQPSVHLTIVGDGTLRSDLENLVYHLNLAPYVTFLGQVPNRTMPDLLLSHAIYLSATSSDGTSISLLEAMACGAFPIISDIPANRPWVTHGKNGFLVSPAQPDLFANYILEAFETQGLMHRARELNWRIVKAEGDHKVCMERAAQAIEHLLMKEGQTYLPE